MDIELVPSLESTYHKLKKAARNEVVFITGPPSTGKTTLVKKLFQDYKDEYLHAYVDCYSVSNQSRLLSIICQAYTSTLNVRRSRAEKTGVRLPEPGEPVAMSDFPRYIKEYRKISIEKGYKRVFIVLDHVEVFERTPLMDTFVALCRFNVLGLRLIVISFEGPEDLIHYVAQKSPAIAGSLQDRYQVVACQVWSKDDTINWILQSMPRKGQELYGRFVRNVVTLVNSTESKDPRMIRMYCQDHFEDFMTFYTQRRREHTLKQLKLDPQTSTLTDKELEEYELDNNFNVASVSTFLNTFRLMISKNKDNSKWTHEDTEVKLNSNSGILIVAAYIAAYTKPVDDKMNFIRFQRGKRSKRSERTTQTDIQNRPFTLERLVQIYLKLVKSSLGDQKLHIHYNNDGVLGDIERLENLNILHHQTGFELSSDSRYKLSYSITRKYVERLARNHDLNLGDFHGIQPSC